MTPQICDANKFRPILRGCMGGTGSVIIQRFALQMLKDPGGCHPLSKLSVQTNCFDKKKESIVTETITVSTL